MSKLSRFVEFGKKIIGVGANYRVHAAVHGEIPTKPIIFLKPTSSYITSGNPIKIPTGCQDLYHEVELGIVIGQKGSILTESKAMDHVGGYFVGLDFTAWDFLTDARQKGLPWCLSKGFDTSCPVGDFIAKEKIKEPGNVGLWLKVNNDLKQDGNTKDMIFNIPFLISYISKFYTLEPGDTILTGTPSGIGSVWGYNQCWFN